MAGSIFWKERTVVTLDNANFNGGTLATLTAAASGTNVDVRASGNAAEDYVFYMELLCQWTTITNISANLTVFDVYMVPALDGTNFADVDTSAGASNIPVNYRVASFVAPKAPISNTNMRFATAPFTLFPALYKPYLLNRSGQTMSSGATLKIASAQDQYS